MLDCGALDLNTSFEFFKYSKNGKVIAFEPDEYNFQCCLKNKKGHIYEESIQLIKAGVGKLNGTVRFDSTSNGSSYCSESGKQEINIYSLDEIVEHNNFPVTFIKMDIEGMEMEALEGAKKTIYERKPKLAISIYHKENDIIDIPLFLNKLVPEYKFYIRHYSIYPCETILYAIL